MKTIELPQVNTTGSIRTPFVNRFLQFLIQMIAKLSNYLEDKDCNLKNCKVGNNNDCQLCDRCPNNKDCPQYVEYLERLKAREVGQTYNLDLYDEDNLPFTSPIALGKSIKPVEIPLIKSKDAINTDNPTVLLMDDFSGIISLLVDDLKYFGTNITKDLNILYSDGPMAAFSIKQFLDEFKNFHQEHLEISKDKCNYEHYNIIENIKSVDIALLDISISGFNYINNEMVEYDGIDIAYFLRQVFPECKLWFVTGHKPNKKNPKIYKYMEKFKKLFGEEIDSYIVPKGSSRIVYFEKDIKTLLNLPLEDSCDLELHEKEHSDYGVYEVSINSENLGIKR